MRDADPGRTLILLASALAMDDLGLAWRYLTTGRSEAAIALAVDTLRRDPSDLDAHHVYITAMEPRADHVRTTYRAWAEEEPGNPVAAVAYARAEVDCVAVEAALAPWIAAEDPVVRWHALQAAARCGAAPAPDLDAPGARVASLRSVGNVDAAYVERLRRVIGERAWALDASLWTEAAAGPSLDEARSLVVAWALAAEGIPELAAAERVLRRAGRGTDADAVGARLVALDPGGSPVVQEPIVRAILAVPLGDAPVALRELRALSKQVPDRGPARALYADRLAILEEALGHARVARDARLLAWREGPTPRRALAFATRAAAQGTDLDVASEAIDRALAEVPECAPDELGRYDEWLRDERDLRSDLLVAGGWLAARRGFPDVAARFLREAVLVAPEPSSPAHLRLGLAYAELGDAERALHHLGRGLAGVVDPDDLARDAGRVAEKLYADRRWSPGGFDGWVASHREARPAPDPSPLLGKPLPPLPAIPGTGIRVIHLWRITPGASVDALPGLDTLAGRLRGRDVQVVLATPEDDARLARFLVDNPVRHATVARLDPATLGVDVLPALVVVDAAGTVRTVEVGWNGSIPRVERAIEEARR